MRKKKAFSYSKGNLSPNLREWKGNLSVPGGLLLLHGKSMKKSVCTLTQSKFYQNSEGVNVLISELASNKYSAGSALLTANT